MQTGHFQLPGPGGCTPGHQGARLGLSITLDSLALTLQKLLVGLKLAQLPAPFSLPSRGGPEGSLCLRPRQEHAVRLQARSSPANDVSSAPAIAQTGGEGGVAPLRAVPRDESSELPAELGFLSGVLKMKVIFLLRELALLASGPGKNLSERIFCWRQGNAF